MENLNKIKEELLNVDLAGNIQKDILIVVYDQYEYVKNCINSIYKNTKNFNLHIWNNNSKNKTSDYLNKLKDNKKNVSLYNSKENVGFIIPNNRMIECTNSPYVILLNSDTEVRENWDKVLIGFLEKNKDVCATGFQGGILNKEGLGIDKSFGYDIDYICGYCMAIPRRTYEEFGLFDEENLKFAYCEDSDFSLRIREQNKKIYACYSTDHVVHFCNKTSLEVVKEKNIKPIIQENLSYLRKRWSKYLNN
jgi:hypothetical protein